MSSLDKPSTFAERMAEPSTLIFAGVMTYLVHKNRFTAFIAMVIMIILFGIFSYFVWIISYAFNGLGATIILFVVSISVGLLGLFIIHKL